MDFLYWLQVATAVMFGNAMTAGIAYFLFRVSRQERSGLNAEDLPFRVFLVGLIPMFFFIGVYMTTLLS